MWKLFDYTGQSEFRSKASIQDCVRRLQEIAKGNNPAFSLFSLTSQPLLVGRVDEDKVALHKVSPLIGNPYKPYFYGKFVREGRETVLRGKFTVSRLVKLVDLFLLVALAIFVLLLIASLSSSNGEYQSGWTMILILLVVCVIGGGMLKLIKRFSSRDVGWISQEIRSALQQHA